VETKTGQTKSSQTKTSQTNETGSSGGGLEPGAAGRWLAIHDEIAWHPEHASAALRDGLAPDAVLVRLRERVPVPSGSRTIRAGRVEHGGIGSVVARHEALGIRVLLVGKPDYPPSLDPLADAPPILLVRGDPGLLAKPAISVVGARAATQLGARTARRLGRALAESGFVVVSGLARGIDGEAHRGALEGGGRTIAVLACGPDRIYPPEHRRIAEEILERGALVSEMPVGTPPRAAHFPLRNRLISGLSLAVIVVEARRRSGSLITVRHALNQGREVFVVPGSVEGPFAEGSNELLRQGARAIRDARDVIEDLGGLVDAPAPLFESLPSRTGSPAETTGDASAGRVLDALEPGPLDRDELQRRSGLGSGTLARVLLELELSGRVVEERDGRIHRRWR
jgi:DNA processing protein